MASWMFTNVCRGFGNIDLDNEGLKFQNYGNWIVKALNRENVLEKIIIHNSE